MNKIIKKNSFIYGAIILTICGVLCKLLGAFYKIPLTNVLGAEGIGIYYLVFPIYSFLIVLSSSSLPVAVSKLVSVEVGNGNNKTAHKIFKCSFVLLLIFGLLLSAFLCLISLPLASLQGVLNLNYGYIIIAPSILLVALISSFRGYFQGLQNMLPTGVSQITEQIFKILFGFLFSILLLKYGIIYGVLGAFFGITFSELFSLFYLLIYYAIFKNKHLKELVNAEGHITPSYKMLSKKIIKIALPFTLGSIMFPLVLVVDSFLIVSLLLNKGYDVSYSTNLLGLNSGIVNALVNLPVTVAVALALAIVPSISYSLSKNRISLASKKCSFAIKLTLLIAIPCTAVFIFFSRDIVEALYLNSMATQLEFNVCCMLLTLAGINVFYLSLLQILTAVLQSVNRAYTPVFAILVALIIKIVLEYFLVQISNINIQGAILSNVACFSFATIYNLISVKKLIPLNLGIYKDLFVPIISTGAMCTTIYYLHKLLNNHMSNFLNISLSFIIGGCVYLLGLLVLKTFSKEDKLLIFSYRKKSD